MTLQHTATHWNTLQHTATHCNTYFLHVYVDFAQPGYATPEGGKQYMCPPTTFATMYSRLNDKGTHCNLLQHTATYCTHISHRCMLILLNPDMPLPMAGRNICVLPQRLLRCILARMAKGNLRAVPCALIPKAVPQVVCCSELQCFAVSCSELQCPEFKGCAMCPYPKGSPAGSLLQ